MNVKTDSHHNRMKVTHTAHIMLPTATCWNEASLNCMYIYMKPYGLMCCYPNFKSSPELEQSSLLTFKTNDLHADHAHGWL